MCSTAVPCTHQFVYHSVVPPTHCPMCGACLGCGQRAAPVTPRPWPVTPWPTYPRPYYWNAIGTPTSVCSGGTTVMYSTVTL